MAKSVTIPIDGMSCDGCVQSVKRVLGRVAGVVASDVKVGEAKVSFDEAKATEAQLRAAIEKAGFTPK